VIAARAVRELRAGTREKAESREKRAKGRARGYRSEGRARVCWFVAGARLACGSEERGTVKGVSVTGFLRHFMAHIKRYVQFKY
jgi:hypothetical protein